MDACNEANNSTDCILQAILDATKDHNKWDVPTFYTTVLIGVVAAGFALIGLVQNLLSASFGHQKCSKYAIGHWHKMYRRRLNWSELHWESIAYTPVLTSRAIQGWLKDDVEASTLPDRASKGANSNSTSVGEESTNARSQTSCFPRFLLNTLPLSRFSSRFLSRSFWNLEDHNTDRYFPATWLHLLTSMGIDQLVWDNFNTGDKTKQTVADYLPSEYQAVPAYMDIDTIVALAAEAGCDILTIEPKSRYPIISGTDIQVLFRQDSFLGLVASFESYASNEYGGPGAIRDVRNETKVTDPINPAMGRLRANLLSACGSFQSALTDPNGSLQYVNALDTEPEPMLGQAIARTRTVRPFVDNDSNKGSNSSNIEKAPHEDHFATSHLCTCQTLLQDLKKRHDFSWLFDAKPADSKKMETFPARSAKIKQILSTVVVQASFWSRDQSKLRNEHRLKKNSNDRPTPMEILALALDFACDATTAKQIFSRLPTFRKRYIREAILDEMSSVDTETEKISECTRVNLYIVSATLMRPELSEGPIIQEIYKSSSSYVPSSSIASKNRLSAQDILQLLRDANEKQGKSLVQLYSLFVKSFDDACATEVEILMQALFTLAKRVGEKVPVDQNQKLNPIDLMKEETKPILVLLIYRTVLLAIICLTALDSSEVLEAGIGSQIVPFL